MSPTLSFGAVANSDNSIDARSSPTSLQVLHWWTSDSERQAAKVIVDKLAQENIFWRDAAIPGGAGLGASKVLKSRVLAGHAPEATQLNGVVFGEWANLGLLLELDGVARPANWEKLLFPTVWQLLQNRGHVVAAPLGIQRINGLFYNKKIFDRLGLSAPQTWMDFERVASTLKRAGVTPLAQSSEAWQVATLFETLVLAESGPAFYRQLFVKLRPEAYADSRLRHALKRLRGLKEWMPDPIRERPWNAVTRQLADGQAGMFVMGDWVKGELQAWGLQVDVDFGCSTVPGTADYHLYSVDTLAMFAGNYAHQKAQEKLAQIVMSAPVQTDYNQHKGSISVWQVPNMAKMDSCALASWRSFGQGVAFQAPSLVHRMATDETTKDAIVAEVRRYFMDNAITEDDTQRRLAAIARTAPKPEQRE
ncbi:ABC transporter substrate-binding protein [Glaciimonas immobilis]|uniref:Probable sugar-binding periplasmic protein n=1 Tax=Glaciimonas immobilis TaxID=728004 RepID=A0A840RNR4_9BURK|nr:ABC transporter substrate-binding protein [Glaciimonas immobilis]MBB5198752.1 glucose/mannose transport system substrate-binding protein [Glaciimonas immobilis]